MTAAMDRRAKERADKYLLLARIGHLDRQTIASERVRARAGAAAKRIAQEMRGAAGDRRVHGVVTRSDGHIFIAYQDAQTGQKLLRAGCFTGTYRQALARWGARHARWYAENGAWRWRLNAETCAIIALFRLQGYL